MIATVIRNLLSNAVKFSYPGGKINLKARVNESHVSYKVSDSGIGDTGRAHEAPLPYRRGIVDAGYGKRKRERA